MALTEVKAREPSRIRIGRMVDGRLVRDYDPFKPMDNIYVLKFGGTSVGTPEMMYRVSDVVGGHKENGRNPVVVTSAMSGVTDMLLAVSESVRSRDFAGRHNALNAVIKHHRNAASGLGLIGEEKARLGAELNVLLENERINAKGETEGLNPCLVGDVVNGGWWTPELQDGIVSYGERLAARLLAAAMRSRGIQAQAVDATSFMATTSEFGSARVNMDQTFVRANQTLKPMLRDGIVPVVTGFIGSTLDGRVTTLGRGGSDFSATVLGSVLGAKEVQFNKEDVDGIYSEDPRRNPNAVHYPEMTYEQAHEMAQNGHKVLCRGTMEPIMQEGIPLRVLQTSSQRGGTLIKP